MDLPVRMRRLRKSSSLRRLGQETFLPTDQLIMPAFVVPGKGREQEVQLMPGVMRRSIDLLRRWAAELQVKAILLFGVPDADDRDPRGSAAVEEEGLVPTAVSLLKEERPDLTVITDLCLCPYTSHGQCGVLTYSGRVDNDATLELLGRMAEAHAAAGADVVAPSAMMDGQVKAVRSRLDQAGCHDTAIMSCCSTFDSSLYRPLAEATGSALTSGNRKGYRLPPPNRREALREALIDEREGADWLMVKPALPCLDVISELRRTTLLPIAAFQASGEYAMLQAAAEAGALDEMAAAMEAAISIKRAGADAVVTYHAEKICEWMGE